MLYTLFSRLSILIVALAVALPVVLPVSLVKAQSQLDRPWYGYRGTLVRSDTSFQMWGTHILQTNQKAYRVKAANSTVQQQLAQYENQTVTLYGQAQFYNLEGGFWGITAYSVSLAGTITPWPKPSYSPRPRPTYSPKPRPTYSPKWSPRPQPVPCQTDGVWYRHVLPWSWHYPCQVNIRPY